MVQICISLRVSFGSTVMKDQAVFHILEVNHVLESAAVNPS